MEPLEQSCFRSLLLIVAEVFEVVAMVISHPCLTLPSGLPSSTTAKLAAAAANLLQVMCSLFLSSLGSLYCANVPTLVDDSACFEAAAKAGNILPVDCLG